MMKELEYFRRQFLLTRQENFNLPWKRVKILDYNLFYHPDLEFASVRNDLTEVYILGFLFDYVNPKNSNLQIASLLAAEKSLPELLNRLFNYSGHFALIYKTDREFIILNDAAAQYEIYYDTTFSAIGSQPGLLGKVITPLPHTSKEAASFYNSADFMARREYIGETTQFNNILHLRANFLIDLTNNSVKRYFPVAPIGVEKIKEASSSARKMLEGFIKAASLRYNITMGVTAGYDSRVLFLASLNVKCKYYISTLGYMNESHHDIYIPKRLTNIHGKELTIITERKDLDPASEEVLNTSVDFPRKLIKLGSFFDDHIIVNGNVSEIARSFFGNAEKLSPNDLAYLYGYNDNKFVEDTFGQWIKSNKSLFTNMKLHILDMSYWEERMGVWAAKSKTEMSALNKIVYSPFCSHKLLMTLLATDRKYRDRHDNRLYRQIIKDFSPAAAKIPLNPSLRNSLIKFLKRLKIYDLIWSFAGNPVIGSY